MLYHLLELRRRTLYTLLCFTLLFSAFFYFADTLFAFLVHPLVTALSPSAELIATQVASPVLIPLNIAANAALLATTPFALFQFWRFVAPALYKNELLIMRQTMLLSMLLFAVGVGFCFYFVLPFMFQVFVQALPRGVRFMPDVRNAVDFITGTLLTFGLAFQVPLVCLLLVRIQLIDITTLCNIRPYVIVSAFIIGMILTPPDVLSQIMLALPLCLLYELGIILAWSTRPKPRKRTN